ncbi:phosphoryl transfer system HPr [Ethanoligenens harbinense YUAN-3]|uniref:Phosphoryl transfer system HPr n=1 Tax=Ethanoligenens harbinense (strain DSM 18485 / JCM 12961 / CGMCC 1.5033 / YUAN-3) TaxID=663278 RepID=E6U9I0_ETHHY|nr:phosphoryl transfer system HPr [Ethanoligenens harbinense YUAN-3]
MEQFTYVIKDSGGIHARPAGMLVKKAAEFSSRVVLKKGQKAADIHRLFSIISLGANRAIRLRLKSKARMKKLRWTT